MTSEPLSEGDRSTLKELAGREDLRCSKWAEKFLEADNKRRGDYPDRPDGIEWGGQ